MTSTSTPTAPTHSATPTRSWLPLAAVAVTLVLWASAFVAIRHLGGSVPPGALSLGRLVVMGLSLGVMVLQRGGTRLPTRREWPLILAGGAAWFGLYNLSLNASEQRVDAGTAALIIQVGPIVVALLATLFFGERLNPWLLVGMAIGFAGVVLIGRVSATSSTGDVTGVLLSVVAALTFAVGVITQKKLLSSLGALDVTFWYCLVGIVVCLPWSGQLAGVLGDAGGSDLAWILYLGVFPSAIAFVLWAYALSHADAGKFALTTFLVPFITALMAWLFLDEVPPGLAFLGGAMCIGGVLLTRRTPKPR